MAFRIVSLSIPQTDSLDHLPYIFGGHLQSKYELVGLHFHWGDKNNRGSEHHINDVRYSMEMHIIHRNINYKSVDEANMHGDGLCVLAFFFQLAQHDTVELQNIVHNLHSLKEYNTKMELNSTFSLSSLIGDVDTDIFYTYKGIDTGIGYNVCWNYHKLTGILSDSRLSDNAAVSRIGHLGSVSGSLASDQFADVQIQATRKRKKFRAH